MVERQKAGQKGVNVSAEVHEILISLATGQRTPRPDLPSIVPSGSLAAYTRDVLATSTDVGHIRMTTRPKRVWVHADDADVKRWTAAAGPMPVALWMAAVLSNWAQQHNVGT